MSKPEFWGYDTGRRTSEVLCCGKKLLTQVAYEQHMKARHSERVRVMKKSGRWQQDRLDGWAVQRSKEGRKEKA